MSELAENDTSRPLVDRIPQDKGRGARLPELVGGSSHVAQPEELQPQNFATQADVSLQVLFVRPRGVRPLYNGMAKAFVRYKLFASKHKSNTLTYERRSLGFPWQPSP